MLKIDVIKEIVEFPKWVGTKPSIPHAAGAVLRTLRSSGEIHMTDEVDMEKCLLRLDQDF